VAARTPPNVLHRHLHSTGIDHEEDGVVARRAKNEADDALAAGGARDGVGDRYSAEEAHERGTHQASEGSNRAGGARQEVRCGDLPAHLEIVPKETIAAGRVDLHEHHGAALSLLTVRYRRKRLSAHLRGEH